MKQLYLIIFTLLAFLPASVFFPYAPGVYLFYTLQVIFLFSGLLLSLKFRKNIVFSRGWLLLTVCILLSISGLILYNQNISQGTIFSYISGIVMTISIGLFFGNVKFLEIGDIQKWLSFFNAFSFLSVVLGVLQSFGIVHFEIARTITYATIGEAIVASHRATSYFIEPSGWASFFALHFLISSRLGFNVLNIAMVLVALFLSLSATGFAFVIAIFLVWIFERNFKNINILKLILTPAFFIVAFYFIGSYASPIIEKIFENSTDYRNVAPLLVASSMFSERYSCLLFGNGVFSLTAFTSTLGLHEKGQTTSNLIADVFFELGITGLIGILAILFNTVKKQIILLPLLLVFISQMGYRSYLFPFVIFVFYIFPILKDNLSLQASRIKAAAF